jgi:soluble cytochrome b562
MQGINLSQNPSLLYRSELRQEQSELRFGQLSVSEQTTIPTQKLEVSVSISSQAMNLQQDVQGPPATSRQSPEQTADNILSAIQTALESAKSAGADQRELKSILKEGAKGFREGFREAVGTLQSLGQFSGDVRTEIKETKQLVKEGFRELRVDFAPKVKSSDELSTTKLDPLVYETPDADNIGSAANVTTNVSAFTEVSAFSQTYAKANRSANDGALRLNRDSLNSSFVVEQSRNALIEIETAEGDVITIDLAAYFREDSTNRQNISVSDFELDQSGGFSVQGELSNAEFAALDDLLNQVDAVATAFFEGDMAQVFARATSIGFDSGQLVGLSMSLTETTLSAMAVYGSENVSANGRSEGSASRDDLRQLGSYVRELGRVVEQASAFQRPENLVSKLLSRLSGESTIDRYDAFNKVNDNLLGALSRLSAQKASADS